MFNFLRKWWVSKEEFDKVQGELNDWKSESHRMRNEFDRKRNEYFEVIESKTRKLYAYEQRILELESNEGEARELKEQIRQWKRNFQREKERNEILTEQYWELKESLKLQGGKE